MSSVTRQPPPWLTKGLCPGLGLFLHLHHKGTELGGFQVPLPHSRDLQRSMFQLGELELSRMVWVLYSLPCSPEPPAECSQDGKTGGWQRGLHPEL